MSHPLKEIRLVKKLTQSQCGRVLNVSGQIVSQIENGSYNPGNEILTKIALTFGLDPGDFIKSVEQYLVSRRRALKKQIASS
ncbi:unnamed protein product [marine sediment metagenome]|uniref:HTH cro/C1-type domain-containing protein n=1 Tax=marine sediment metagenome TaxID=412755 RepID=X1K6D6_9ZZZZ